jgi:endonuclease YncB( thermonuclease family)
VRTANKVWSGIAATVFCIVAVTDMSNHSTPTATSASTTSVGSSSTASSPYTPYAVPSYSVPSYPAATVDNAASATAGETVTVTKVVDGDTIEVTGGRQVRFLGIDACEMTTQGGRDAKDDMELYAPTGSTVTLVTDGDKDKDPYDRLLRRVVSSSGSDVGEEMIGYPPVGIYQGHNDASAAYLADLQARDDGPRACGGTPTPTYTPAPSVPDNDDDHHDYAPAVPLRPHTGHSGHPCLPGERDGDHDGYCGEGR